MLGISAREFTHFAEVQQKASGPGESAVGVANLSMRIHPKSCRIFPPYLSVSLPQLYLVFQGTAQLKHSSCIVKVGVETTC